MQSGTAEIIRFPSVDVAPTPLTVGTVVASRYQIEMVYGRGAYATVYRARDLRTDHLVALKVLSSDRPTKSAVARFRRELAISREVSSPNLVQVFDFVEAQNLVFIVMEAVDGTTLRARLTAGPLPLAETIRILQGILTGLTVLHGLSIVHRDLKPANVLISSAGLVKIADLGLAIESSEVDSAGLTGTVIGTVTYMAPEQALGAPLSPQTDLYSLGVIAYECLTGRLPHKEESPLATLFARLSSEPTPPRKLNPSVPRWLNALVLSLLSRDPKNRPASAGAVLAQIQVERAAGRLWSLRVQSLLKALYRGIGKAESAQPHEVDEQRLALEEALIVLRTTAEVLRETAAAAARLESNLTHLGGA